MSDNPSKLMMPLLEEANFPTWRPAMEACLSQLGVFRIVTSERTAPQTPNYVKETPATATDTAIPLTQEERLLNAPLNVAYDRELTEFRDRQEKAAGDILVHPSPLQRTHVSKRQDNPAWMWAMLKSVHLQQVMRFSAYNDLFSIVKGLEETLPAVTSRVEEAIARVIKLRPKQITEVSTSPGGFTQTTRNYAISDLNNELALMVMLCALPCKEYADFVSSLMRQKDLTRANIEAMFQVEQTEGDAHRSPLLSSSGDAALCTAAQPPRQNKPGVKRGFCTGDRHTEDDCYKKERACKDAQKVVEERRASRNSGKKARANRAAATSPSSPAPSDSAKVTELAASASVRLAGSRDLSANGGCGGIIVSRDVMWSRVAHDTIPVRFSRAAEPGDAERSPDDEEVSDSTDSEGVMIPVLFELAAPSSDSDSSSSSSQSLSTASPTPSPPRSPPRTPLPREEWSALSPQAPPLPTRVAPWPQQQGTVPVVAPYAVPAPWPAAQHPAPTAPVPAPNAAATGLQRSARSNAGVVPAA
jgi:hypothetical protein